MVCMSISDNIIHKLSSFLLLRFMGEFIGAKVAVKSVGLKIGDYLREGDLIFEVGGHPHICQYFGVYTTQNVK